MNMKKQDLKVLRKKSKKELEKQIDKKRLELAKHAVKLKIGKKKNLKKGRLLKREIAQILTVIRENELIEQSAENKQHSKNKN